MREIAWIKSARRELEAFPAMVRERIVDALVVATFGEMAVIAKPMTGLGSGVFEIAVRYRTDAYRCIYAVQNWRSHLGCPCVPDEV